MILDKCVNIKLNGKLYKYYSDKGYETNGKKTIEVLVSDLTPSSHIEINVKCDYCNQIKRIQYRYYVDSKKIYDKYSCKDCSKNKNNITNIKRFGVKTPLQNKEIKEKQENTCKKRFGFKNAFQNEDIKKKIKESVLEKYGVEYPSQSRSIIEKIKNTNLKRYGTTSPLHNPEILEKVNKTNLYKYGHIYPARNPLIKIKTRNTNIERGYMVASSEFDDYKNEVRKITRRYKEKLFRYWDGNDFYDNEYIKENMLLHPNDKNYPTIDHKISVLYGFLNKISPSIIGNIKNLCITKRSINSSKSRKTIDEFKKEYRINEKSFSS